MQRPAGRTGKRRRRTFSLRTILAVTFGTLVAVAVGAVLFMSVMVSFANTFSLLNDRAISTVYGMEDAIRAETARAEGAVAAIASLYARREVSDGSDDTMLAAMRALLTSEKTIEVLIVLRPGVEPVALLRNPDGRVTTPPADYVNEDFVQRMLSADIALTGIPLWAEPAHLGGNLYHVVLRALTREGKFDGVAIAAIGRDTMNRVVSTLGEREGATAFVLNSRGELIAHSKLPLPFKARDAIPISEFPDEALREFPEAELSDEFSAAAARGISVYDTATENGHAYLTKELTGYSPEPYTLGAYFPLTDIGGELRRTVGSIIVGLVGLLLAVVAAVLLGTKISRPMNAVAEAAEQLSKFELESIQPLPRSRIREVDHQAVALNRTRVAMAEFSRYVPKQLVARLLRTGRNEGLTEGREVTIMFTDIVGFTGMSERLDAAQTAAFLNDHFETVCRIIEDHGGTVDKFMGDSVMAFWGAPEADPRHACNAVESARLIANAIHADNRIRRRDGLPPVRLRIGIHSGEVVVGNIGGGGRQNYTIVGDAVNVAQRLEQLGRQIMRPEDEVVVLASETLVKRVQAEEDFVPAGTRVIRGREKPLSVWMLDSKQFETGKIVDLRDARSA